jgi:hypothetical protein
MRVFYHSRLSKRSPTVVYEQGPVDFCCEGMCRWWGQLLGFGARDSTASTSKEANLYLSRPQANGTVALELVAFDFCPWCAQPVETCLVK